MELYKLKDQLVKLNELVESGDLPAQAIADTFEALEGEFNDKVIQCTHYLANTEAEIDSLDKEIKRLQAMKKTRQNAIESFRDYMRINMENSGITKIESPLFKISLGKGQEVVEVDPAVKLPEQFTRVKTEVDKTALKAALKNGEIVDGARLVEGKSRLTIK